MWGSHDISSEAVVSTNGLIEIVEIILMLANNVGCDRSGHSAGLWINICNTVKRDHIALVLYYILLLLLQQYNNDKTNIIL